jgi:hypothetical protein
MHWCICQYTFKYYSIVHSLSITRLPAHKNYCVSISQPHGLNTSLKFGCDFHFGLISVDATIFTISPDAAFKIRPSAYLAVVTSSIASGLGIACVIWLHLRYQWIAIETFIVRTSCAYRPSASAYFRPVDPIP